MAYHLQSQGSNMQDLYDIISDAGMSARPAFYSGRGAISCDLNSRITGEIAQRNQRSLRW